MRKVIALFVAVISAGWFAVLSLGSPTPAAAINPISFTLTSSGNTVTLTPSGAQVAAPSFCSYNANITWSQYPNLQENINIRGVAPNGSGVCPTWTFSVPNPNASASSYSAYTVTADAQIYEGSGAASIPNTKTITVSPSTAQPAVSSSLPAVFWTVSPTSQSSGSTITMTAHAAGATGLLNGSCATFEGLSGFDCLKYQVNNSSTVSNYNGAVGVNQPAQAAQMNSYANVSGAHSSVMTLWLESNIRAIAN